MRQYKMFGFIKKCFRTGLVFLSTLTSVNLLSAAPLCCISLGNQECKGRPQILYVDSAEHVFFPFNIKISKCGGSCNNINNPYAKLCVPDVVKKLNVRAFNLMSRTNEKYTQNGIKRVSVNVDQMQAFVITNNAGMMINADMNVNN